jgi:hypothetical protein
MVCYFDRWQHLPWEATMARVLAAIGYTPALVDSTGVGDPIVETMQRTAGNIRGFKFTQGSKQQLMEGLAMSIQQRRVGVLEGPMRAELDSFEYEPTRTGVRYAAPEGLHDDCVVALALANEQGRSRCEVGAQWVYAVARPEPVAVENPQAYFHRMRQDWEWGWERVSRWN